MKRGLRKIIGLVQDRPGHCKNYIRGDLRPVVRPLLIQGGQKPWRCADDGQAILDHQ